MRLRNILLALSLLVLVSAALGGFFYYHAVERAAFDEARRRASSSADLIQNQVASVLSENLKPARALAGLGELASALANPGPAALARANAILDHFQAALEVDVCYLMNAEGLTVASSNRGLPDDFVGQNFGFRPYFKGAMAGGAMTYLALGTTSGKRGAYFSYPVRADADGPPLGVAVIKVPIREMEKDFLKSLEGIVLLVGPHGVIFSGNRPAWLYHTLWQPSEEDRELIAKSRQFGSGPWPWVGLSRRRDNLVADEQGREFLLYQRDLAGHPGWKIIYLRSYQEISRSAFAPLVRTTGLFILAVFLLTGISVHYLYRKASSDIVRRRRAEEKLRGSEERYRSLYHNTPAMLHSVDTEGRLVSVSDYWSQGLGYRPEEVIGRQITDFLTPESRQLATDKVLPEFWRTGRADNVGYSFVKKNGQVADMLLSAIAEHDDQGKVTNSLAVLVDITERRQAEEELRRTKEMLAKYSRDLEEQVRRRTREITSYLKNTPAMVYMKDKDGRYLLVNHRFEELLGVSHEQAVQKTETDLFPPELARRFRASDERVRREKKPIKSEERFPQPDGERIHLSVKFPVLDDAGAVDRICGISIDITELKRAQDQLRRLSGSIMAGQEKERAAIARELHDELGQVLTALRMDAVWLMHHLSADDKAAARARTMTELIDHTISDVRSIATRLRPAVLDDLGLIDGLDWLTADFEKRTGISCVFSHSGPLNPGEVVSVAVYRVCQEALTNVVRHAEASRVEVSLKATREGITLAVEDDGRGFDLRQLSEADELGVAGMRERASLLGGRLTIDTAPERGTRVVMSLPPNGEPEKRSA